MARTDFYYVDDSPPASRIVPAASAVVVGPDRKVLLQRRQDSGSWSLPGGVMNVGETIVDCCVREVREETGFEVSVVRLVGIYSDPNHRIAYSDGEVRQQFSVCFECEVLGGDLGTADPREVIDVQWFAPNSLPQGLHPAQELRIQDWATGTEPRFR